jgi:hypothetical protein
MSTPSLKTQARKLWQLAKREGYELAEGASEAEVIELLAQRRGIEERLKQLLVVNQEKRERAFQRRISKSLKTFT